jgi:hypothetical protein
MQQRRGQLERGKDPQSTTLLPTSKLDHGIVPVVETGGAKPVRKRESARHSNSCRSSQMGRLYYAHQSIPTRTDYVTGKRAYFRLRCPGEVQHHHESKSRKLGAARRFD